MRNNTHFTSGVEVMSDLCCPVVVAVRSKMTEVSHQQWGEVAGLGTVDLWVLQSSQVRVEVLTLGAIIRSVCSRGKDGQMEDVVQGFDDLEGRMENNCISPHRPHKRNS